MAFIVEDGTGIIDANAYITTDFLKDYLKERGRTTTKGTSDLQAAIIQATDYIEVNYKTRFKGSIEFPDTPQALSWPRINVYDANNLLVSGIPSNLERATAEYADRALTSLLQPDPEIGDQGQALKSYKDKVGPIEEEREFFSSIQKTKRSYPAADNLLKEYLNGTGGGVCRG